VAQTEQGRTVKDWAAIINTLTDPRIAEMAIEYDGDTMTPAEEMRADENRFENRYGGDE
jgi:hypothetical protein